MFCFAYIEGLKDCPICGGAITGWDCTCPRKKPGPTRIGTKFDGDHGAVPANIVQVEAKSPDCPALEAEKADSFADDSSDGSDSDSDNGLVKWCGSEDFSNGGARSHQDLLESEVPIQEIESELPSSQTMVGSRGAKRFATVSNLLDSMKTDPQTEGSLHGCKWGRSRHPTQRKGRKFKKIVEMATDDGIEPVPELRKRSVGPPPSASKSHGQKLPRGTQASSQGPVKSACVPVQQVRTTLRRREVQDIVPVKFRGM